MNQSMPYRLFAEAFDRSPTLFAILDRDLIFRHVNNAYAERIGHQPSDLIGRNYFEFFPERENEAVFRTVLDSGEEFFSRARPLTRSDGTAQETTYWDWQVVPVDDDAGSVEHLVLIIKDATDQVLLGRELEYNYGILLSLFEHSSIAVVRTDTRFRHLFANHAYYALFGLGSGPGIGTDGGRTQLPEPFLREWKRCQRNVLETGVREVFLFELPLAGGKNSSYQGEINPERDTDGTIRSLVTFLNDVTAIKDREEELENLLVEMNHRIKNNLANIAALAHVELAVGDKTKEAAIDDIISRVHAIGQVHQTLYETRSFSDVSIGPYLRELLESLLSGAGDGNSTYSPAIEYDELEVSSKIATKLGLMIAELVTNTIKYAGCGESCTISVRLRVVDREVTLVYSDSGSGFSPGVTGIEDLQSGTGMMILSALIGDLDGTITLDTAQHPPRFLIRFPLASAAGPGPGPGSGG